jgi:hypothetical protein
MRRAPLLLLATALFGCASAPKPCTNPLACSGSEECVANRCAERASAAAAKGTERVVLEPMGAGILTESGHETGLPPAVTFGSRALGRTTLYLAFPLENRGRRTITSAFVLLEPLAGTAVDRNDVKVEAWRIRSAWQPASLGRSTEPSLGLPKGVGIARAAPRQTLRIDVTELVRYLDDPTLQGSGRNHGLALTAAGGDGHGASFATGAGPGRGPRLEIYLR